MPDTTTKPELRRAAFYRIEGREFGLQHTEKADYFGNLW